MSPHSIFQCRHAQVLFDELAEGGVVLELEEIGDSLQRCIGVFQFAFHAVDGALQQHLLCRFPLEAFHGV